MNKTNITDTITYVTGLGSGYVGISSIPTVSQPLTQGNVMAAILGIVTLILQFLIMTWNKRNEMKNTNRSAEINDLQRQISELKTKRHDKQFDCVDQ